MNDPVDLVALLEQALTRVERDPRRVWCKRSVDFESRLTSASAELCGGLWSPLYLGTEEKPAWSMALEGESVVHRVANARAPLTDWIPMLEAAVKAKVSLVLIAGEVETELLHTLLVNHLRSALHNALVHPGPPRGGARVSDGPAQDVDALPRARLVWSRRAATAIFPEDGTRWAGALTQLAVLEVGGANAADVQARAAFIERRLAEMT